MSLLVRGGRSAMMLALVLGACGFEPEGEEPFDPPAIYREWHARTVACSGVSGDFDRIRWFVIEGDGFECPSGRCAGRWQSGHDIYLASAYVANEMVVRHEMLHDLLGRSGHPDPPFGDPCPLTWETWRADGPSHAVVGAPGLD